MKTASPDTLLAMQKELSTPAEEISAENTINKINVNDRLNALNIKTALFLGVLNTTEKNYYLDFDQQLIPTEKYDATYSYKKKRGYFPAVDSIDNLPVYLENRNGNCSVKFQQLETLKRALTLLKENGITPGYARMDCGSYIKEVCEYLDEQGITFYIRAEQSEQMLFEASLIENWEKAEIGFHNYEVGCMPYRFGAKTFRIVAYRCPNKTGQTNLITADANNYLFILTNDETKTAKEVIEFYNDRGNSERLFDIQNNDFNWKKMPFSFLEQNTVYLLLMAFCHILYRWIICIFSKCYSFLQPKDRLKKFIFRLVCIPAKVIRSGHRTIVKLFSSHLNSARLNSS